MSCLAALLRHRGACNALLSAWSHLPGGNSCNLSTVISQSTSVQWSYRQQSAVSAPWMPFIGMFASSAFPVAAGLTRLCVAAQAPSQAELPASVKIVEVGPRDGLQVYILLCTCRSLQQLRLRI